LKESTHHRLALNEKVKQDYEERCRVYRVSKRENVYIRAAVSLQRKTVVSLTHSLHPVLTHKTARNVSIPYTSARTQFSSVPMTILFVHIYKGGGNIKPFISFSNLPGFLVSQNVEIYFVASTYKVRHKKANETLVKSIQQGHPESGRQVRL